MCGLIFYFASLQPRWAVIFKKRHLLMSKGKNILLSTTDALSIYIIDRSSVLKIQKDHSERTPLYLLR
jgi:hypothetical protein